MSEQWYCPNCGIDTKFHANTDYGTVECLACESECVEMPPFVLAMQERIAITEDSLAQRWETINCQDNEIDEYKKRIAELKKESDWLRSVITEADEKVIPTLENRIAELESAQRWVPCRESPPDDMVEIYETVCYDIHTRRRYRDEIYWQFSHWEVPDSVTVEYWREIEPLPPPPQEQGE